MRYPYWILVIGLTLWPSSGQVQESGCFNRIHDAATPRDADYAFDLRFDRNVEGDSFSCILHIRASAARKAIDDFRAAVLYEDESAIARVIKFPLSASVHSTRLATKGPETFTLHDASEWLAFQRRYFDKRLIGVVSCTNVRNVEIVASRTYAFMIASGIVRFQQPVPDDHPRVTGVSVFPLTDEMLVSYCAK